MLSYVLAIFTQRSDCTAEGIVHSPSFPLLPFLGLVTVGIGDAVAAIVGSKCGRWRWVEGNSRTVEGTVGGFLSMCLFAGR